MFFEELLYLFQQKVVESKQPMIDNSQSMLSKARLLVPSQLQTIIYQMGEQFSNFKNLCLKIVQRGAQSLQHEYEQISQTFFIFQPISNTAFLEYLFKGIENRNLLEIKCFFSLNKVLEQMSIASHSRIRRNNFPGMTTQHQISNHRQSQSQILSQTNGSSFDSFINDSQIKYFFKDQLQSIQSCYLDKQYEEVLILTSEIIDRYEQINDIEGIKKNIINLTLDLRQVRSIAANSCFHLFKIYDDNQYLYQALRYLNYRYEGIETAYKKAQRLNNLGLCQMLLRRYNNAYHYFAKAFHIYTDSKELNLKGLIKNIIAVFKNFQMYEQAMKYFQFIFQEIDKSHKYQDFQYSHLVISALQCVNEIQFSSAYASIFQRAKQFLPKISNNKQRFLFLSAKLKLQLIKYAIFGGIEARSISDIDTERYFHQIMDIESEQNCFKFLKGECCYFYRQIYRYKNWDQYRELTKRSQILFNNCSS